MSSVVAEANSQFSSQPARPKSGGQGGQSASDTGFSGLVDNNLAASRAGEASGEPRHSAREGGAETQPVRRTGLHARSPNSRDAAASASDAHANKDRSPETAGAHDPELAGSTSVVPVEKTAEPIEDTAGAGADDSAGEQAGTVIVAVVAVPPQVAIDTTPQSVIDGNDAVTVSNPAATMIGTPAEIAANALARVAGDVGEDQGAASGDTRASATTDAAPAADATTSAATTAETTPDASAEVPVAVETAAPDAQIAAKAATDLSAATKVTDPVEPAENTQQIRLTSHAELKPVETENVGAELRSAAGKVDAPTDGRPETNAGETHSHQSVDAAARQPQRSSEEAAQASTHKAHATSEQAQPQNTGFGVSHTAPPQTTGHGSQAPQLTAVPAANVPVPISGVAVQIAANVQIGRSRFEIRLDPPELGRIDVRLDVDRQGHVTSHLIVEKSATLDLLRRDAQQLERALQDAGLKTSDNGLQFSLRDQQQQQHRNDDNAAQRNVHRLIVNDEETVAVEAAGRSYGRMSGQRGGIDIRV